MKNYNNIGHLTFYPEGIVCIDNGAPFRKPDDSSLAEQNIWPYKIGVTAK